MNNQANQISRCNEAKTRALAEMAATVRGSDTWKMAHNMVMFWDARIEMHNRLNAQVSA